MATVLENLTTAYANYATQLAAASAGPKIDYTLDGETYNWTQYQAFLIDKMLTLEEAIQRAAGPYELRTQALS